LVKPPLENATWRASMLSGTAWSPLRSSQARTKKEGAASLVSRSTRSVTTCITCV
jgi:hypothetical protein